jgi:uncharacterized protein YraI
MTSIHAGWRATSCAAVLIALSSAGAVAESAYVKSTVNLRSAPGTENEIIGKIPSGSLVEATNCSDWCAVDWQGKSGYAIRSALDTGGRVPAARRAPRSYAPPPAAYEDDEVVVGGPAYFGPPVVYYGYPYRYRPFGYYRYRPYYGYRYGGWRRRW